MKKIILLLCIAFCSFTNDSKDMATVQEMQGIKIFIFCKPVAETNYLGRAKVNGVVLDASPKNMLDRLVKACKKQYPEAQGLIINDFDFEKGDAVSFK